MTTLEPPSQPRPLKDQLASAQAQIAELEDKLQNRFLNRHCLETLKNDNDETRFYTALPNHEIAMNFFLHLQPHAVSRKRWSQVLRFTGGVQV